MGTIINREGLKPVDSIEKIAKVYTGDRIEITTKSIDKWDNYVFTIEMKEFRIKQTINDKLTMIVNSANTLYFENPSLRMSNKSSVTTKEIL